ncbi:hypothetical protein [Alteromonas sp. C1M14]|uniref:hypothetical protein n=1 Tax=Alteromonas sp. C1M14 TaxID=2841567 RepID=UPI001C08EF58|nr:hypothetical protein [Alteromonas sp. C1M14]MBU2979009.1 hypothetical protein [Alteromonas sp. C1M14]
MTPSDKLNKIKLSLESLVPNAYVTRNYEELNTKESETKPIYAVVSAGFPRFGDWYNTDDRKHKFMIIAQQWVSDSVNGEAREELEFTMLENITTLVQKDGETGEETNIEITEAHQSRQMDPNHAWVVAELQFNDL